MTDKQHECSQEFIKRLKGLRCGPTCRWGGITQAPLIDAAPDTAHGDTMRPAETDPEESVWPRRYLPRAPVSRESALRVTAPVAVPA